MARGGVNTVVGIDMQSIEEVRASLIEFGARYTRRLYTNHEIEVCEENPGSAAREYAARFAAKEAALKILKVRDVAPSWKTIEVRRSTDGRPWMVLFGSAANLAQRRGINQIALSISFGPDVAIAIAQADVRNLRRSIHL